MRTLLFYFALYSSALAQPFSGTSSLQRDLVAYYGLEEASGTRYDRSTNGFHLTATGSPTNVVGVVGNACKFLTASTQYLSHADTAGIYLSNNFEIHLWAKLYATNTVYDGMAQWDSASNQRGWIFQFENTTDRFRFLGSTDGISATGIAAANTFGAPSSNVWYHVALVKTSTQIGISVNNGPFDLVACSGNLFNSTSPFYIGALGTTPAGFWNGEIDEVGIWKRVLTQDERDKVYSLGHGSRYPWANSLYYPITKATTIATNGFPTEAHTGAQNAGIVTAGTKTLVFYVDTGLTNYVVQYDSVTRAWSAPILIGSTFSDADHGYASAAVDSSGYIHVFYGCHSQPIHYRRSSNPNDGSSWTTDATILDRASYPEAVIDNNDTIYCFFRSGPPGFFDRQYGFTKSTDRGTNWSAYIPITDSGTDNLWVYSRVAKGTETPQNSLHVMWTARWNSVGTNDATAFTNIWYGKSLDGGTNWKSSSGTNYTLPISVPSAGEVAYAGRCVLVSQMGVDTNNKPLLLFIKCDPAAYFTNAANSTLIADVNSGSWNVHTFPATNYYLHSQIAVDSANNYRVFSARAFSTNIELTMAVSTNQNASWWKIG